MFNGDGLHDDGDPEEGDEPGTGDLRVPQWADVGEDEGVDDLGSVDKGRVTMIVGGSAIAFISEGPFSPGC